MGIASLVLSLFMGLLFAGIVLLVFLYSRTLPPDAEETGLAAGIFVVGSTIMLSELAALGLGIAGAMQRRRKKLFALLGVACSVIVLAVINSQVGLVDLASGVATMLTEPPPEVHVVSPEDN